MSSVEYHEGALTHQTVDAIVVGKLSKGEPIAPVGLSIVDKDVEILFNLLVDSLCLSISLGVEHSGGVRHDVKHPIEFLHELGDKLGSLVGDHGHGHAMSCVDVVSKDSGPSFGGEFSVASDRDDGFRKLVDNHQEGIMPVQLW